MHSQQVEKLVKEPNHNAAKQQGTESMNIIKIKSKLILHNIVPASFQCKTKCSVSKHYYHKIKC